MTTEIGLSKREECCTAGIEDDDDNLLSACKTKEEFEWSDRLSTCSLVTFLLDANDNIILGPGKGSRDPDRDPSECCSEGAAKEPLDKELLLACQEDYAFTYVETDKKCSYVVYALDADNNRIVETSIEEANQFECCAAGDLF